MVEITVDFDQATQGLGALREAAYRMIGQASCQIESAGGKYLCRLTPMVANSPEALRHHFLALVTDENLREKVGAETSKVRDIILALAFGALATRENERQSA